MESGFGSSGNIWALPVNSLAEQIDVTPKFCSDIETGAKGCPFLHFAGFPKYFVCPPITSFMEKRNRKILIPL